MVAGDIGLIGRLSRAETGDTLSSPEQPRVLKPWTMPTGLLPVAIEVLSRSDEDKLSPALGRLRAEDPSLRIEWNAETGQVVLWVMGEAHADQALDRLRNRYGVAVTTQEVVIPLRETFTAPAKGHGRHVKQSGGHGQYAICDVEVEPLPQGGGFEFVDKVVGGAVPRQFISSVEKGVRAQMERGVRHGYPVVDIKVTLTDGKAHSVDSSDAAFQSAGALALREAADAGEVALLEPYDDVAVHRAERPRGRSDERALGTTWPAASGPRRQPRTARRCVPQCPRPSWCATRSICAPRPMAQGRSPGPSPTTS